jgi:hypothetical protein
MPPQNLIKKGVGAFFILILFFSSPSYPDAALLYLQVLLRESGKVVWEKPITSDGLFHLIHCNSMYLSTVWEAFRVDTHGAIWLCRIKSENPAVLEYYGLGESSSNWIPLSRKIGTLFLLLSKSGKTRLEWDQGSLSLSEMFPEGTLIEIRTGNSPGKRPGEKDDYGFKATSRCQSPGTPDQ